MTYRTLSVSQEFVIRLVESPCNMDFFLTYSFEKWGEGCLSKNKEQPPRPACFSFFFPFVLAPLPLFLPLPVPFLSASIPSLFLSSSLTPLLPSSFPPTSPYSFFFSLQCWKLNPRPPLTS